MNSFETDLDQRLAALREEGLYRELRRIDSPQSPRIEINGRALLNFSSNDYLGLANEPAVKEAAIKAIERYGAGAGASRLVCGSLAPHHELEEALAGFKGTTAALSFSSGYAAAVGTICALLGKDDVIIVDKLVHASIIDAARLCGAKLRVFAHNDVDDLEKILKWTDARGTRDTEHGTRVLVVTESIFSMDGDAAPLRELVALKEKYGAWLMVDEAHATGLYGAHRRGLAEKLGVSNRIEVQMGTLGKALGSAGGYICGSRALIDFLVNRARSFIFSTAPVPATAAAATAGLAFVKSRLGEERCSLLWDLAGLIEHSVKEAGWKIAAPNSAILPIFIGDERQALDVADRLRERGVFVPAIRYPTVARGEARLRVTVTAAHQPREIAALAAALAPIAKQKTKSKRTHPLRAPNAAKPNHKS